MGNVPERQKVKGKRQKMPTSVKRGWPQRAPERQKAKGKKQKMPSSVKRGWPQRPPVVTEIPTHVRGQQPVHPAAQVAVATGPKHEMEMVRHQAVGHDPHRHADAGLAHNPDESRQVPILVEYF